jgi:alkanesulfonate monooxygenase SsuD/methylene tetrahydromethanopterin reductase-like flavin-dependent oxidoreductase (luciferase family)
MSEGFMQDRWFLGTPADIAGKIVDWQPRLDVDHIIFQPRPPGMSLRQAVGELEVIAKEVIPVVKRSLTSLSA